MTQVYLAILRFSNYYPAEVEQIKAFSDKQKRDAFMIESNQNRADDWHWTGWEVEVE